MLGSLSVGSLACMLWKRWVCWTAVSARCLPAPAVGQSFHFCGVLAPRRTDAAGCQQHGHGQSFLAHWQPGGVELGQASPLPVCIATLLAPHMPLHHSFYEDLLLLYPVLSDLPCTSPLPALPLHIAALSCSSTLHHLPDTCLRYCTSLFFSSLFFRTAYARVSIVLGYKGGKGAKYTGQPCHESSCCANDVLLMLQALVSKKWMCLPEPVLLLHWNCHLRRCAVSLGAAEQHAASKGEARW